MAKQLGIYRFGGKVGQAVGMKGESGEVYLREHVIPKNPNTKGQIEARVKMSLAGQLSKITPKSAIFGMGGTARKRRSNFTGNIARNAIVATADGISTAELKPKDLIFSQGVTRDLTDVLTATFAEHTLTVTASAMPEDCAAIVAIAVFSETATGNYNSVQVKTITKTQMTATFGANQDVANVYYIPVMQAEGASRASYERAVANIEATSSYAAQADTLTSGVFNYGGSTLLDSLQNG